MRRQRRWATGGVTSDVAQPGLSPMGSLGGSGVDASVEQRRNAISDALQNQPAPVPEVPPENPTQPGTQSLSPTTASLPSTPSSEVVSSDAVRAPPMGATAQASPLAPPVGYGNMRVAQEPGPAIPAPRDTSQGITPAPAAPPSALPIPPETLQQFPDIGKPPTEPKPFGPSETRRSGRSFAATPIRASSRGPRISMTPRRLTVRRPKRERGRSTRTTARRTKAMSKQNAIST